MNKYLAMSILMYVFLSCGEVVNTKSKSPISEADKYFLELWEIFDNHYAFFELRGIDWEKEKAIFLKAKQMDNDSTIFNAFCNILKKFDDTHINLESEQLNLYCNSGKVPDFLEEFPTNEDFNLFLEARTNTLKKIGVQKVMNSKSGIFQFGINSEKSWGYLRIKRFYGASLEEIKTELDEIHQELGLAENIIIDIRANPGGNDETALLCAGYFFKEKEIAFIKQVRNGKKHTDFSLPDTTYVTPINSERNNKNEKIYLLTNRASGSSADVFALIMSYLPKTKIIGKNTEGIFSNMYRDTLSNGFRITLSNERYFSREMECYEKIGVPVDETVSNKMEDVINGVDLVIQRVIQKELAANKGLLQ